MILYGDTSALAKLYLDEAGSGYVKNILEEVPCVFTSVLTHLELVCAIEIAKRIRRITSPIYRTQAAVLDSDILRGMLTLLDVNSKILKRALPLIRVRRLRSPDAIHLATALELNKRVSGDLHFLCADHALLDAARMEGLRCKDVSK